MLSFSIKQLQYCVSTNSTHQKAILLSYTSPLIQYTFLNIHINSFSKTLDQTAQHLNSQQLIQFLSAVRNKAAMLKRLQDSNYPYIDIQRLHSNLKVNNQTINNYQEQIKETAQQFAKLTAVILSQTNNKNLVIWMEICLKLQIIDIRIWSNFVQLAHQHFSSLPYQQQQRMIMALHTYLQSYFMKNTYTPNKFLYRQNAMNDIDGLEELITLFLREILPRSVQNDQNQQDQAFRIVVQLILKINRSVHIKLFKLQAHYKNNQTSYISVLNKGNISTAVTLFKYLSFLGIYEPNLINTIQQRVLYLLEKEQEKLTFEQKSRSVLTILHVWSSFGYSNPTIYTQLIRPMLIELLEQPIDKNQINTSLLYNMICSKISDEQMLQKLMGRVNERYPIQSRAAHIITHYLSIKNRRKILSSFPHCIQNKLGLQIAGRNKQVYSNCMTRSLQDYPQKQKYRPHDVCFQSDVGKEANPPEEFWQNILQIAFKQLTKLYPHADNQIIFNFHFCAFQIDALIAINQQYLAFEYEGLHYKLNSDDGLISKGNKLIKNYILQAYGIKLLQIDSTDNVVRTISSFRDKQNGAKYLLGKLQTLYNSQMRERS